jgi:hypothetical protein
MYAVYGVVVELDDSEVRHAGDALRTHRPQLVVRQVPENKLVLEIIFFSVFATNVFFLQFIQDNAIFCPSYFTVSEGCWDRT